MMDDRHKRVLTIIQQCRGRKRALTAKQIGRLVGIGEREVRAIIADLRREGHPIASAVHPPYGFYLPADAEEARECQAHLYSRMRELGVTARALDAAFGAHLPGRQLVLSLFKEGEGA